MKIAIDISQVIYETGVSWYTKNLLENLLKIDKKNEYLLFGGSLRRIPELKKFASSYPSATAKIYPLPPTLSDILFNILKFPKIEFFTGKIDVLHSSDWSEPPTNAKKVTTVHDLWPILNPKLTNATVAKTHKRRLRRVRNSTGRIIVPSESTKNDLVKLGFDKDRIHVIYEAPDKIFQSQSKKKIAAIKKKYQLPGEYILSVGVGERKNTKRAIEAYEKIKSDNLKYLIVGRQRGKAKSPRGVRFLGHIPFSDLATLYAGAKLMLYPSLYEGFGLPILEAFASSTPVVTSNTSSMPEVAGGAAVLVDPLDVNSIVEGIKNAMKSEKKLVRLGKNRVKDFSWEKTAKETLKIYNL